MQDTVTALREIRDPILLNPGDPEKVKLRREGQGYILNDIL